MKSLALVLPLLFAALHSAFAADALVRHELTVDGVVREALLWAPAKAKTEPAPLVFAFHGHGGNMNNAARMYHLHTLWPEAIVIYPQGLNTPGQLTDPEGKKPGWQGAAGLQGDRDLKFFDAMLASLEAKFKVDPKRIYSTGHSNGGGFTYLLWAERGDKFAAFGPSAAAARRALGTQGGLKPKPMIHIAGEKDPLVKFEWQKLTMEAVRKTNQCGEGTSWEGAAGCTLYPSEIGAPVVTFIHPGTHTYPGEAPALIVKFFKQHALP
jgi:polyhydroxybutyrate depolymerase